MLRRRGAAAALGLGFAIASVGSSVLGQGLIAAPRMSAALAHEAVGAAVARCATQGYGETAVLLDTDGVVQASLRGDGTGVHTLDSAHDKAYTAVTFKSDTLALLPLAPQIGVLMTRLPHLLLAGGGVVIKSGGAVVGAIGASGAPGFDLDDACAKAGVQAIQDRMK